MAGALPANRGNRSANRVGPAVSRRLKAAGVNIMPVNRRHVAEGTTVRTAGDMISILVDHGNVAVNDAVSSQIMVTLTGWGSHQVARLSLQVLPDGAVSIRFKYTAK